MFKYLHSGYMPPEYVMGGAFSVKSDTYSFGVLVLEIVSGLKISSPHLLMNSVSLTAYVSIQKQTKNSVAQTKRGNLILLVQAWRLWGDGRAAELVHSSVIGICPLHEVLRCIHVGLLCVQGRPDDRPLMSSVMLMLESESALLPAPKQPAYSTDTNYEPDKKRRKWSEHHNTRGSLDV